MRWKIIKKNKLKVANSFVEPDEIFLDSENLQNFDSQQFEGRIEKQIGKRNVIFLGIFFIFSILIFSSRLVFLQIKKGQAYFERSQNNSLERQVIFAERGIIYDRNKIELAWNQKSGTDNNSIDAIAPYSIRTYKSPGFGHLLGYINYPQADSSGNFWQTEFIGKDGLEKIYNSTINGQNGSKIVETDVNRKIYSENIINAPVHGAELTTAIDSRIQGELFALIKSLSTSNNFSGGAGILMDAGNGEVLTEISFPEYDSNLLSLGKDSATIKSYLNDPRKVFLDRTISGLYTPGSIVKPFFAIGALAENVIDPNKKILSTGSISIQNPYFPDQKTIFKDWRVNGWVNMAEAIAVSCDIYFYEIGGGYQGQKGMGIANIEKYARLFGFGDVSGVDLLGEKSGIIPSPEWKIKNFNGDPWRIGDTYHTAIGQYGFQVTPMEMIRAVAAIANDGTLVTPHLILGDKIMENKITTLDLKHDYFNIVQSGMREAVTTGTAVALNVPYVQIAAKTGTAQLGVAKNRVNSWVIGFFPYDHPRYAFTVMMEAGPSENGVGASSIMRGLLDWMSVNTPEYFK